MLWEQRLAQEPEVRLAKKVGVSQAAAIVGMKEPDFRVRLDELRYRWDFEKFSRERLWIINKLGELVRFIQNSPQRKMDAAIERQQSSGKPVRLCLLKARQWGGSTKWRGMFTEIQFYDLTEVL